MSKKFYSYIPNNTCIVYIINLSLRTSKTPTKERCLKKYWITPHFSVSKAFKMYVACTTLSLFLSFYTLLH